MPVLRVLFPRRLKAIPRMSYVQPGEEFVAESAMERYLSPGFYNPNSNKDPPRNALGTDHYIRSNLSSENRAFARV